MSDEPSRPAGRAGRRPGKPDTRGAIVGAARELFADHGFRGASMRSIAARAGVDTALMYHYFRSKRDLLLATVDLGVDPVEILAKALTNGTGPAGQRIVDTVTRVWDSAMGAALTAVISGALSEPKLRSLIAEYVDSVLIPAIITQVGLDDDRDRDVRAGMLQATMVGLLMGRYVLKLQSLAALPRERVVANYGAIVQHILTGPVR